MLLIRKFANRFFGIFSRPRLRFVTSDQYWDDRYRAGLSSGPGSYGRLAEFKADTLNDLVREKGIQTVIEFGCGDGHQLTLARYPRYLGIDVSQAAIELCDERFRDDHNKRFLRLDHYDGQCADLALSLDVIYHLVEDQVFENYMQTLFTSARRCVVVYSSNTATSQNNASHVRHRHFTDWVERNRPGWRLESVIHNPHAFNGDAQTTSFADFYVYVLREGSL